ncbi:MAG: hypothetical protein J6D00_06535 [Christensenellaceae bacterium]|nr:hypothetical protein [Christensenellaceae bacterium]
MLPENYKLPYGFLPFVSKTRTVFVGDKYTDDGDLAVNGGFASNGDYSAAKKALIYARSPYKDALQHEYVGSSFLDANRGENPEVFPNIGTISDTRAVIDLDKIDGIERMTDYTGFSRFADAAMKKWGLWDENVGLVDIDHSFRIQVRSAITSAKVSLRSIRKRLPYSPAIRMENPSSLALSRRILKTKR